MSKAYRARPAGYRVRRRHPDRRSTKALLVALSMMNLRPTRVFVNNIKDAWMADDGRHWMIYCYEHNSREFSGRVLDHRDIINGFDKAWQLTPIRSTLRQTLADMLAIIEAR